MPERRFALPVPAGDTWHVWEDALAMAAEFRQRAAKSARVSEGMRAVARMNARSVAGGA